MRSIGIMSLIAAVSAFILVGVYINNIPGNIEEAEKAFEAYIMAQGVDQDNIATKTVMKDYKVGGYVFDVTLKDEPSTYRYNYFYDAELKTVNLIVFDDGRSIEDGMKYPPLPADSF